MVVLSVSVPEELKHKMEDMDEVNWSAVARRAFEEKVKQIELLKSIAAKSKLTDKDALELGKKVNKAMHERYKKEYGAF